MYRIFISGSVGILHIIPIIIYPRSLIDLYIYIRKVHVSLLVLI